MQQKKLKTISNLFEGNETVTNCDTFKLRAKDGKMRNTDIWIHRIF